MKVNFCALMNCQCGEGGLLMVVGILENSQRKWGLMFGFEKGEGKLNEQNRVDLSAEC